MNDRIKNDEGRALKLDIITPGYHYRCGSVKKHVISESQELEIYNLYKKFTDDVFKVLLRKEAEG